MVDSPLAIPPPGGNTSRIHELWQKVFFGPNGMRAGWRLLVFFALLEALASIERILLRGFLQRHALEDGLSPAFLLMGEASLFAIVLLASWIMARIEGRTIATYGLPWRNAFQLRFWQGVGTGFVSISALMAALRACGVFHFGTLALRGVEIWRYGLVWAVVFLAVALFEEFSFRGYILFTLTTGVEFWPSALIVSLLFGYVHHGNPGETWLGAFTAGVVGLLFCLLLRRTGDLWMPIGFHSAWDWGETYFYGVPDSGQVAPGHLLNSSFAGPRWLTGGTVGPEASWLCLVLLAIVWCIFSIWVRSVKYPNPAAIRDPRQAPLTSLE